MKFLPATYFCLLTILGLTSLVTADSVNAQTQQPKCPQGFELQTKGKSVICFKPETNLFQRPLPCPHGHRLVIDQSGLEDKCVSQAESPPKVVNILCPKGYNVEVLRQQDRCKQIFPAEITTPLPS